jgi:hypothetical protein
VVRGERAEIRRHEDHLKLQGEFQGSPHTRDDYKPVRGERAPVIRQEDHLKLEGDFTGQSHLREAFQAVRGERAEIHRREDHFKAISQDIITAMCTRRILYTFREVTEFHEAWCKLLEARQCARK